MKPINEKESIVFINGLFLKEQEAKVSVFDRSYLIGEGLFETIRVLKRRPLFLEDHLERLLDSAQALQFQHPFSAEQLRAIVDEVLIRNRLEDGIARIHLSPESETIGDYETAPVRFNLLVSCRSFAGLPSEYYTHGVDCIFVESVKAETGMLVQYKTTNYYSKIIAKREAQAQQAFEGILLTAQGQIAEGSSSHLFMVKQGKILTPPLSAGVLKGITRQIVIQLIEQLNLPFEEVLFFPEELQLADEAWLTSSLKGVLPIRKIAGKLLPQPIPGRLTLKILKAYQEKWA